MPSDPGTGHGVPGLGGAQWDQFTKAEPTVFSDSPGSWGKELPGTAEPASGPCREQRLPPSLAVLEREADLDHLSPRQLYMPGEDLQQAGHWGLTHM